MEEVNEILNKAKIWKGPLGYRRIVSITRENDYKYYTIYEVDPSGIKSIFRQFSIDVSTGNEPYILLLYIIIRANY